MELLNEKSEKLATRRTYKLLKAGLFHLLMEMPFEKISLTEICTRSLVPRSTFTGILRISTIYCVIAFRLFLTRLIWRKMFFI